MCTTPSSSLHRTLKKYIWSTERWWTFINEPAFKYVCSICSCSVCIFWQRPWCWIQQQLLKPKDLHILTNQLTNGSICNLEFKRNSRFWYITVLMCNPITFNSGHSPHVYWLFLTKNWSGERNYISSKSTWYNWGTGRWGSRGERGRKQIRSVQLGW